MQTQLNKNPRGKPRASPSDLIPQSSTATGCWLGFGLQQKTPVDMRGRQGASMPASLACQAGFWVLARKNPACLQAAGLGLQTPLNHRKKLHWIQSSADCGGWQGARLAHALSWPGKPAYLPRSARLRRLAGLGPCRAAEHRSPQARRPVAG